MLAFIKTSLHNKLNCTNTTTNNVEVLCYNTVSEVDTDAWLHVAPDNNMALQLPYLTALEHTLPTGLQPHYIIVKQNNKAIFILYAQMYSVETAHLNTLYKGSSPSNIINAFKKTAAETLYCMLNCSKLKVLIIGNILQTGGVTYAGNNDNNSNLTVVINALKQHLQYDAIIIKDVENGMGKYIKMGTAKATYFYTQPNMVMHLPSNWHTFNDYLAALDAKYKKRYNNTYNKNNELVIRQLTNVDIATHTDALLALYKNVYDKSTTKVGNIQANYFAIMQNALAPNYIINGYFLKNELVAFASYFTNNNTIIANYVGFNYSLNKNYKLYQTILYNYIKIAIENKCTSINYGRTGLEIKSTVGAVPKQLGCYFYTSNKVLKAITLPFLKNIDQEKLELRHPFKI